MNSCMRQTGSMNPMRNNFTSGMNCSDMKQKTTNCTENKDNAVDDFPIGMAYVPWQQWRNVVCQYNYFLVLLLSYEII